MSRTTNPDEIVREIEAGLTAMRAELVARGEWAPPVTSAPVLPIVLAVLAYFLVLLGVGGFTFLFAALAL